jgi:hypothetical protein
MGYIRGRGTDLFDCACAAKRKYFFHQAMSCCDVLMMFTRTCVRRTKRKKIVGNIIWGGWWLLPKWQESLDDTGYFSCQDWGKQGSTIDDIAKNNQGNNQSFLLLSLGVSRKEMMFWLGYSAVVLWESLWEKNREKKNDLDCDAPLAWAGTG